MFTEEPIEKPSDRLKRIQELEELRCFHGKKMERDRKR